MVTIRPFLLCVLVVSSWETTSSFVPRQTRLPGRQLLNNQQNESPISHTFQTKARMAATPYDEFVAAATDLAPQAQELAVNAATWLVSNPIALAYVGGKLLTFLVGLYFMGGDPSTPKPYPLDRYDAETANKYFKKRLPTVLKRASEIAMTSLGFGLSVWIDTLRDQVEENEEKRGLELASLLTKLGPTFIKVGQTLSIRTDLLSPAYIRGLQSLQDRVPAFDTEIAKKILEEEWGVSSIDSVVDLKSNDPVAAASLGQVYKARLKKTGQDIAIKVQRPDIDEQVALDMYLLRTAGVILKKVANLNSDAEELVDTWGVGFVDELDYLAEARNSESFMDGISSTPLKDVVFSPRVLTDLSTRRVLTTEWVDGERLDRSNNEDVTILCSIAMNTYLTMMLELGTLHCDPVSWLFFFLVSFYIFSFLPSSNHFLVPQHPGNLLRTPEGRLCILDWGMVTKLDNDLQ